MRMAASLSSNTGGKRVFGMRNDTLPIRRGKPRPRVLPPLSSDVDFGHSTRQHSREWSKYFSIGSRPMNPSQFGWRELRSFLSLFGTDLTATSSIKKHLRSYTRSQTPNVP